MPIPLPNLDTRRWADLVEEGRALIPRHAPTWTDHNAHDPGITLVELFAWIVEQLIYRANRIPLRHRLKFLDLVGYPPRPPEPARVVLGFALAPAAADVTLPPGLEFVTDVALRGDGASSLPLAFTLLDETTVVAARLVALQVHDGVRFADRSRALRDGLPTPAFGDDPATPHPYDASRAPALYLGFDRALPVTAAADAPVSLFLHLEEGDEAERHRLLAEAAELAAACEPAPDACPPCPRPWDAWCPEDDAASAGAGGAGAPPTSAALPPHHSASVVWEIFAAGGWRTLDATLGEIVDETRSLTIDGAVRLRMPVPMVATSVGVIVDPHFYLRCRLVAGEFDAAPVLRHAVPNGVRAEQRVPAEHAADGTGLPAQHAFLPGAPVARGEATVRTSEAAQWHDWTLRRDLDASGPLDRHASLDATTGELRFGDGARGRVPSQGATIAVAYATTAGARGNVAAGARWRLADTPRNQALLGGDTAAVAADLARIANAAAAAAGADAEEIGEAAARAAAALWSHERLVELCPAGDCATLDQLDPSAVLEREAPWRATTLVDFERLALDVPGTRVRRARAWAGLDPDYPCVAAAGTVTVVVVPHLPRARPMPGAGLLRAVRRYLTRRRVMCTRLVVTGPRYVEVTVRTSVRVRTGADPASVRGDVLAALDAFLHPLLGGPAGRGWPFGRDVYRSEILHVVDAVPGVDHVVALSMSGDGAPASCGNLCVGLTALTTSGPHHVEVARA